MLWSIVVGSQWSEVTVFSAGSAEQDQIGEGFCVGRARRSKGASETKISTIISGLATATGSACSLRPACSFYHRGIILLVVISMIAYLDLPRQLHDRVEEFSIRYQPPSHTLSPSLNYWQ